eukprot:360753-Chlamydomonas_euryale.AAC.2
MTWRMPHLPGDTQVEIWADDEQAPPSIRYTVTVYTSDLRGAGTDANVSIIMYGDQRNSPLMKLDNRCVRYAPLVWNGRGCGARTSPARMPSLS